VNAINFCGVFVGHVNVFGHDEADAAIEVLSMIDQILNSEPSRFHPELVAISSADEYFSATGGDIGVQDDGVEVGNILWAVLGILSLISVAGFWWFCVRNEKQGDTGYSSKTRSKRIWGRSFRRQQRKMSPYNPEERSIKTSCEPEAVAFGGGDTLLLTDGRPHEIDFDPSYSEPRLDPRARHGII
jgi:hypothetical protein